MSDRSQTDASIAFALLAVGTVGLMLNEYVLHFGTVASLALAAINMVGLAILVVDYVKDRRAKES